MNLIDCLADEEIISPETASGYLIGYQKINSNGKGKLLCYHTIAAMRLFCLRGV